MATAEGDHLARPGTRLGLAAAVVAAFALIATGCGGDDDDDAADTGLESLQAGETGGEAETAAESTGDAPVGVLEFGTESTITVDAAATPNTLSIPPGSVTTVTLEAAAANSSTAGLASRRPLTENGSITASLEYNGTERTRTNAQPGGGDETQLILTDQEGGQWYVKVWGQGAYEVSIETTSQTDGGDEGDAPDSSSGAVAVEGGHLHGPVGQRRPQ